MSHTGDISLHPQCSTMAVCDNNPSCDYSAFLYQQNNDDTVRRYMAFCQDELS